MSGKNRFFKFNKILDIIKIGLLLLPLMACFSVQAQTQAIIAVLDLKSDGSLLPINIQTICIKISEEIARNKNYNVFDRKNLPFILEHLNLKYTMPCEQARCFSDVGNQIGADQIVGGAVSLNGGELRVELERVDVKKQRLINKVDFARIVKKEEFMAKILPDMVKDLMGPQNPQASKKHRKKFYEQPVVLIGTATIAAVAIAVTVFTLPNKPQGQEENQFLLAAPKHE